MAKKKHSDVAVSAEIDQRINAERKALNDAIELLTFEESLESKLPVAKMYWRSYPLFLTLLRQLEADSLGGVQKLLSPVENGGASRWKMAARGIEGLSGLAPGEPGNGIG